MKDSTTIGDRPRRIAVHGTAALLLGASVLVANVGLAQEDAGASSSAAPAARYSTGELEDLVGRIALYPDDLIAIILPASTYPLQVVEAERFEDQHKSDPSLKPDESWDDSVVALLNYPEVLRLMNDDLEWTAKLGDAVASQQPDVFDAIQSFRTRALANGSLRSDEHQVVTRDEGDVAIRPADPEVVYVPYYEPARVIVYGAPIYYYPFGYPLYYYPYPAGHAFSTGFFWGVTTAFVIGWHTHHIHVTPWTYVGHPYYGRHYYSPFYVRNPVSLNVSLNLVHGDRGGYVWRARPARAVRYTHPVVRSYEGRYRGQYSTRSSGRLYDERRYTGTTSTREGYARGPAERIAPSYRQHESTRSRGLGSSNLRSESDRSVGSARTYRSGSSTALRSVPSDRGSASRYREAPRSSSVPGSRTAPSYRTAPSDRTAPRAAGPSGAARSSSTYRSGATSGADRGGEQRSRGRASGRTAAGSSGRGHYHYR